MRLLRKIVGRLLAAALVLLLLLAGWIVLNSQDSADYDDQGLLALIQPIPAQQNAYPVLSKLDVLQKQAEATNTSCNEKALELLASKSVDEAELQDWLRPYAAMQTIVREALRYEQLQFPLIQGALDEIPPYAGQLCAARVLALQARLFLLQNNYTDAASTLRMLMNYGFMIQTEKSHTLISWVVGDVIIELGLESLPQLLAQPYWNRQQQAGWDKLLSKLADRNQDGFSEVFNGELYFLFKAIPAMGALDENEAEARDEAVFAEMSDFFYRPPFFSWLKNYYFHPHETFSFQASRMKDWQLQAHKPCNAQVYPAHNEPGWVEGLGPNALGLEIADYSGYFLKRCKTHTRISTLRVNMAAQAFYNENGRFPVQSSELVPDYLAAVPVDDFDEKLIDYAGCEDG
ncbi:MAG: hypothetical protein KZQ58_06905 [gamma proteobacterium symbiont of Bathyaustriella thionipta]|nr:hypothetical protein [gamma proteobacterium symbiont of Bathyaustriella thionipta]